MEIFNNASNVNNRQTNVSPKSRTRTKTNIPASNNGAVRIFIDPSTLASKEYKLIQKENNSFPIYNPNVLLYDEHLNLQFYEKL